MTEVILGSAGGILESASIFDEFRSDEVGGRSVAWRLVFRSRERTLRDKEVDKTVNRVLGKLREALGVSRREG